MYDSLGKYYNRVLYNRGVAKVTPWANLVGLVGPDPLDRGPKQKKDEMIYGLRREKLGFVIRCFS
jgi:hypothetical protein